MKKTGIWIDKRAAKIVHLEPDTREEYQILASEVEELNPIGGSGSPTKGGPQDVVQDSKFTEREKHQLKRFFSRIAEAVADADQIVIFGPGQTGRKLQGEWEHNFPQLAERLRGVEKADSMTDNQVKAWVREYFDSDKNQGR